MVNRKINIHRDLLGNILIETHTGNDLTRLTLSVIEATHVAKALQVEVQDMQMLRGKPGPHPSDCACERCAAYRVIVLLTPGCKCVPEFGGIVSADCPVHDSLRFNSLLGDFKTVIE